MRIISVGDILVEGGPKSRQIYLKVDLSSLIFDLEIFVSSSVLMRRDVESFSVFGASNVGGMKHVVFLLDFHLLQSESGIEE